MHLTYEGQDHKDKYFDWGDVVNTSIQVFSTENVHFVRSAYVQVHMYSNSNLINAKPDKRFSR